LLVTEINPGNTATGLIVFDVPEDTEPVQARLAGGLLAARTSPPSNCDSLAAQYWNESRGKRINHPPLV
jgi:hypothetical protein